MDKDYEQIMLKLEALELELREYRKTVITINRFIKNAKTVLNDQDNRIKRLERVIIPKIAEDV